MSAFIARAFARSVSSQTSSRTTAGAATSTPLGAPLRFGLAPAQGMSAVVSAPAAHYAPPSAATFSRFLASRAFTSAASKASSTTSSTAAAAAAPVVSPAVAGAASAAAAPAVSAASVPTASLLSRCRSEFWSPGMRCAVTGWSLFASTHLVMSHTPIRERLIALCGSETKFRMVYGAIAATIVGATAFRYWRIPHSQRGPRLHNLAVNKKTFSYTFMAALKALGAFGVTDAYMAFVPNPLCGSRHPEPTDPVKLRRMYQVAGMQRVTRHNEFFAFSVFAFGSLMSGRYLSDLVLWGAVPLFGMIGAWHQEQRLRKIKPQRFFDETSFVPFAAIADGRQQAGKIMVEISPSAYAAAFVVMGLVFFY